MTICVSRPQADSFSGHAKNVTFLQRTDKKLTNLNFIMIKAALSLLEKQNKSIVNLLSNIIGCLVTKLLMNAMSTKTMG